MLCECGCGFEVTVGRRFRQGHWAKTEAGARRLSEVHLKGAPADHGDGYRTVNAGFQKGHKLQHRVEIEIAIGRELVGSEVVHHKDENRSNNDPSNLIVCRDHAEHMQIHMQKKALEACGHENWLRCVHCRKWDDPANLVIRKRERGKRNIEHQSCGNEYRKNWAATKRAENKAKKEQDNA